MSRLHNPGPGELLDRLSILALKMIHGQEAGVATLHWREEFNALEEQLGQKVDSLLRLAAVNAALWGAEERLQELRGQPIDQRAQWSGFSGAPWVNEVAGVAVKIQSLNDRRAQLVKQINHDAGVDRPDEKL